MNCVVLLFVLVAASACARSDAALPAGAAAGETSDRADPLPLAPADGNAAPATDAVPRPSDAQGERDERHPPRGLASVGDPARYDGYADLRLGMTAAEVRRVWIGELQGEEIKADNCAYLSPAGTAAGPYLMFEEGRFVRYDVRGANTVAPGGGRVGLAADDIRRMYAGRVEEQPHHYVDGGRYLRVADPATKGRALLFEIDEHGRVTTWRVGRTPQVDYVEGCA